MFWKACPCHWLAEFDAALQVDDEVDGAIEADAKAAEAAEVAAAEAFSSDGTAWVTMEAARLLEVDSLGFVGVAIGEGEADEVAEGTSATQLFWKERRESEGWRSNLDC